MLAPRAQAALGQLFIPAPAADLIASMPRLDALSNTVHILDPGAGVGSLTAALVSRLTASALAWTFTWSPAVYGMVHSACRSAPPPARAGAPPRCGTPGAATAGSGTRTPWSPRTTRTPRPQRPRVPRATVPAGTLESASEGQGPGEGEGDGERQPQDVPAEHPGLRLTQPQQPPAFRRPLLGRHRPRQLSEREPCPVPLLSPDRRDPPLRTRVEPSDLPPHHRHWSCRGHRLRPPHPPFAVLLEERTKLAAIGPTATHMPSISTTANPGLRPHTWITRSAANSRRKTGTG